MYGYRSATYAAAFEEFGVPYLLPNSGGWVLIREIPGTPYSDAMGLYPLFCCSDWTALSQDLDTLAAKGLVSLVVVTDPFGDYNEALLNSVFHRLSGFKEHYVADLSQPIDQIVSKNHRYQVRRVLKDLDAVEVCETPRDYLDDWVQMYSVLIERYDIRGIRAFSRESFARQLETPGILAVRAVKGGETVGINIAFCNEDGTVHDHLFAMTDEGYALGASYPLYMKLIEHVKGQNYWIGFGARAGNANSKPSGLDFFKKGWSTTTRTTYLCGKVFNQELYNRIIEAKGVEQINYFPAYRAGDF